MKVLLFAMGPTPPGEAFVSGVTALHESGASVRLISRGAPAPALAALLDEVVVVPTRTRELRLPAGMRLPRPLAPLRKLRADPGRLACAVRTSFGSRTRALVAAADVLVAVDEAAIPAVWLAARRNRSAAALDGVPAAVSRLV